MMGKPALSLGVLVLVLGAQVLCSSEKTKDQESNEDHVAVKRSYDFGLGKKRGYTYVSEYKRLPVYNFGLGKRSFDFSQVNPDGYADDVQDFDESDYRNRLEYFPEYEAEDESYDPNSKRARPYSFGLGKRLYMNSDKRPVHDYAFGLGKRYDFGLGKRSPYDFGLGKRTPYDFGLGKRSIQDDDLPEYDDLGKRSPYEFGLGKRSPYEFGLGKRSPYEFGLGKRSPYEFGLGKRSPYEFGLGKKSYEFGLGKRSPYEFGLGKKSGAPGKRLSTKYRPYDFALGRRQRDLNRFNFGLGKRSAPDDELDAIFGEKEGSEEVSS